MKRGYIYVLENKFMPELVKIGKSSRSGAERAKEIYRGSTGVPVEFDVVFEILSQDIDESERTIFEKLSGARVNGSREFFKIKKESCIGIVANTVLRTNGSNYAVVHAMDSINEELSGNLHDLIEEKLNHEIYDTWGWMHEKLISLAINDEEVLSKLCDVYIKDMDELFKSSKWRGEEKS